MKIPRVLRLTLLILAALLLLLVLCAGSLWIYFHPQLHRTNGLVYGQRRGHELMLDVVRPAKPNGVGILLMVSGGWKSSGPGSFQSWMAAPLFHRGYTLFAVYHVSQPEATVMEIAEDVNRAVRFVRHHAREYGIDPQRLGVTGGSAGGHLSLLLATRGGPGPASGDPIDSETSAVQAVAIFYPVTDLLNLGDSTENMHDGGPPRSFVRAFGPNATNLPVWRGIIGHDLSPIYYVTSNLPPTLIYHGDADTLVPLDQSRRFQQEARKLGRTVELVVHHRGKHGWLSMLWDIRRFADWFDHYLR